MVARGVLITSSIEKVNWMDWDRVQISGSCFNIHKSESSIAIAKASTHTFSLANKSRDPQQPKPASSLPFPGPTHHHSFPRRANRINPFR